MAVDVIAALGPEPPKTRRATGVHAAVDRNPPRFVLASELLANLPPEPKGVCGKYIVPGIITALGGPPKIGKSTLSMAMAEAVGSGAESFLGQPINGGPVLYVSEEAASTLKHKMPAGEVYLLTRDLAWPRPSWEELIDLTAEEAKRTGAVLVVIDTLAHWSGFEPEREKDAGAMQAKMAPLQALTRDGVAVLLDVHSRKGGGEHGEGLRGSNALPGAVDIILELERIGDAPRQRAILSLSRYPSTPGLLIVDHDPHEGSWSVIGESAERGDTRAIADREAILKALRSSDEGLSREALERAVGAPRIQWKAILDTLQTERMIRRSGRGVKGEPYLFQIVRTDAAQAPAQKRAETGTAAASDSAALPVGEQQKEADAAANPNGARCAESIEELQARVRALTELSATEAEREWQRLREAHG